MAQRFGGSHSPEGVKGTAPRKAQKGRSRANLLALAAVPLLFTAFGGGPVALAQNLVAFGAIVLAAWLTREGLEAEDAYNARTISRRPTIPRKILGAILTGLGVGLASFDSGVFNAGLYAVIAGGLHIASFGLDPMANKGMKTTGDGAFDGFQSDRVARAVDEAESHLNTMLDAIKRTGDRVLLARVEQFQQTARTMFRSVEQDPRDLTAVRKYMGVYLLGARDASLKFADLSMRAGDAGAKEDYTALLDDLEQNFAAKTQTLIRNNRTDLDIEIDVLRDRLKRDGVTLS